MLSGYHAFRSECLPLGNFYAGEGTFARRRCDGSDMICAAANEGSINEPNLAIPIGSGDSKRYIRWIVKGSYQTGSFLASDNPQMPGDLSARREKIVEEDLAG